jgi:PAS domain S-box-containing protein
MTQITGCTLEEINRRGWIQTLQANARDQALLRFEDLARGREARAEEWTITRPDGAKRVVALSTSRIERAPGDAATVFLFEDVTQRWQAQHDLELEERRLRTALTAAGMISWDSDLRTSTIHFSADVGSYFGRGALSGPGPFHSGQAVLLIAPHHRELVEVNYRKSLTVDGDFAVEWEGATTNEDGSPRWFATLGKLFADANGNAERTCGVTWEITERRRAEEERRALEHRMQEARRFECLGILAGGIAHEFNNQLTSILGYAGLAKAELPASLPARDHMVHIENAACRAAALCSQMLAAAGRGRFVLEPVDISQLVRESMVLLKTAVARPTVLSCILAADAPGVIADTAQIRQVVMNLITNASEALGGRGGAITLATGIQELDRADFATCVHCPDLAPGTYVFLQVSDDGPGISPEIIGRIFEPFFSTKFTGRGLGLAAVQGIVRGHHGAVHVASEPEKGSTFRVFLPVANKQATPAPTKPPMPSPAPTLGEILVVDDEPRIRKLTMRMLRHAGYKPVEANDGIDALERLSTFTSGVRLVLMDLTMPRLDGIETAREMRRHLPNLPIILMSGFSEHEVTQQTTGMPFMSFLQKPFNNEEFLEAIRAALADASE